jgi:hypothetical protein
VSRDKIDWTVLDMMLQVRRSETTVRRWLWFLRIRPSRREWRWYSTDRGQRRALTNLYPKSVIVQLKKFMKHKEA